MKQKSCDCAVGRIGNHLLNKALVLVFCFAITLPLPAVVHDTIDVAVLGDSNTWLGGDECNADEGWTKWFVEAFHPRSCHSYARSGATWTNTSKTKINLEEDIGVIGDDNVMMNQILRLVADTKANRRPHPDLIILAAGTNDVWFRAKRPEAFGADTTVTGKAPSEIITLRQAVAYGCTLLKAHFPQARIIVLTPMETTAATAADIKTAGDIIEATASSADALTIRMDRESCVKRNAEIHKYTYTKDGTHTNRTGARLNGRIIAAAVDGTMNANNTMKNE